MTKRPSKPGRQKLEDRLISPSAASPNEVACDLALGGLDRMAREMDRKWGVDQAARSRQPRDGREVWIGNGEAECSHPRK